MQQQIRKERFFFDVPRENLDESSRVSAAARWSGLSFEATFGYLDDVSAETEVDRLLEERYEATNKAAGL